jgi:hypothetical protein
VTRAALLSIDHRAEVVSRLSALAKCGCHDGGRLRKVGVGRRAASVYRALIDAEAVAR